MEKLDIIKSKIHTRDSLRHEILRWRLKNNKLVFTNGCFDILHRGHAEYLAKAAGFGNILIVGVNSDNSVKRLNKGPARPIQDEQSRAFIIASLHVVSAVILFDEDTPYELIKFIQPDVLVKGGDYKKIEEIAGYDIVRKRGGEVKIVELVEGYSTSEIEKKIKNNE